MKTKLYIPSRLFKTAFINIKHDNTVIKKLFFKEKYHMHYKFNTLTNSNYYLTHD